MCKAKINDWKEGSRFWSTYNIHLVQIKERECDFGPGSLGCCGNKNTCTAILTDGSVTFCNSAVCVKSILFFKKQLNMCLHFTKLIFNDILQQGYVIAGICLSFSTITQTYKGIFIKFTGNVNNRPRNTWLNFGNVLYALYVQSAHLNQFFLLTHDVNVFEEMEVNTLIFWKSGHCLKIRESPKSIQERLIVWIIFETPPRKAAAEQQSLHDTDYSYDDRLACAVTDSLHALESPSKNDEMKEMMIQRRNGQHPPVNGEVSTNVSDIHLHWDLPKTHPGVWSGSLQFAVHPSGQWDICMDTMIVNFILILNHFKQLLHL